MSPFVEALGEGGFVAMRAARLRLWTRRAVPLGKWGELGEGAG